MQVISGCLRLWHFPLLMIIRPVLRIETYSEIAGLLDLSARFRHAKVAALARNRIAQSAGSFCGSIAESMGRIGGCSGEF